MSRIIKLKRILYRVTNAYITIIIVCRQYTVDYKLETYLKIARLYLEDDDPVQAEAFINRASLLQVRTT